MNKKPPIKELGLIAVKSSLSDAKLTLTQLSEAKNSYEFAVSWKRVLDAVAKIYNKISLIKDHIITKEYDAFVKERKIDPMLNYFLHARNAEIHGVEQVIAIGHPFWHIGAPGHSVHINSLRIENGIIVEKDMPVGEVQFDYGTVTLSDVFDRGRIYKAPSLPHADHEARAGMSAELAANRVVSYLETKINQFELQLKSPT